MPRGPIARVRVRGKVENVRKFLAMHPMESQCVVFDGNTVRIDIYVNVRQREALRECKVRIEEEFDASSNLRARQAEVSHARLADGALPEPVGRVVS